MTNRRFNDCARLPLWSQLLALAWMLALSGCRGWEAWQAPSANARSAQLPPPTLVAMTRLPAVESPADVQLVSATVGAPGEVQFATELATTPEPVPAGPSVPITLAPPHTSAVALTLFDAIETALMQNPDLTTLRQSEGVSLGALGVARTYPFNPYVQLQVLPGQDASTIGPDAPKHLAHYVLVQQTLQLARQQRRREEIALAALGVVRWNILQAELLNVAATERLYFAALYQRGVLELARSVAQLNDELLAISERQLGAGQIAGADVAIVRLDALSARRQYWLAEANYQTALLDLRRQLGLPLGLPLEVVGELADWRWLEPSIACEVESSANTAPPLTSMIDPAAIADLVSGRPDVMAARADLAVARANAGLARANRVPDLMFGPYYARNEGGVTFWGFRAQSDVPVWNNGQPLVRQRQAELRQRQTAWQQLQYRAEIEAQTAVDRYERARRLVTTSAAESTVALPTALAKLETQFQAGEVDVVRVVTARASLIQTRRAHLDLLNEAAQAAAAVTAATGLPPQSLAAPMPMAP